MSPKNSSTGQSKQARRQRWDAIDWTKSQGMSIAKSFHFFFNLKINFLCDAQFFKQISNVTEALMSEFCPTSTSFNTDKPNYSSVLGLIQFGEDSFISTS